MPSSISKSAPDVNPNLSSDEEAHDSSDCDPNDVKDCIHVRSPPLALERSQARMDDLVTLAKNLVVSDAQTSPVAEMSRIAEILSDAKTALETIIQQIPALRDFDAQYGFNDDYRIFQNKLDFIKTGEDHMMSKLEESQPEKAHQRAQIEASEPSEESDESALSETSTDEGSCIEVGAQSAPE